VCSGYRPRSKEQRGCWCQSQWSSTAQLTNPSDDGLSTARNAAASDAAIFFKWTLGSHWPNADSAAVFLEKQFVTGANAQSTANLVRHRDLSLACDSRLLFQKRPPIPYFTTNQIFLLMEMQNWKRSGSTARWQRVLILSRKSSPD
jgi:hypothetical protein